MDSQISLPLTFKTPAPKDRKQKMGEPAAFPGSTRLPDEIVELYVLAVPASPFRKRLT
jgi:hypothetical protein